MVLKKKIQLTPESLIATPQRSPAIPNEDGTHALFTVSTYSVDSNTEIKEVKIIDLRGEDNAIILFSNDNTIEEPQWLVGTQILWKKAKDGGCTELWTEEAVAGGNSQYLIAAVNAPISNIKMKVLDDGKAVAIAFTAPASIDGNILNPETLPKPTSTAREYETIRVRFWDTYRKPYGSTLWYTTLIKDELTSKYLLHNWPPINALKDTAIEFPWCEGPLSGGSYEIAKTGLLINTVDPKYDPAKQLTSEVFYIPLKTFLEPSPKVTSLSATLKDWTGSAIAGTFSQDGELIAFLKRKDWKREWANPAILLFSVGNVCRTTTPNHGLHEVKVSDPETGLYWDRSPSSLIFSDAPGHGHLFAVAEDRGRNGLFRIALSTDNDSGPFHATAVDIPIPSGSITSVYSMKSPDPRWILTFFVNTTSFIDSSIYQVVVLDSGVSRPELHPNIHILSSATNNGANLGLQPSQVKLLTFPGAGDYTIHAYLLKPSFFNPGKKYPVALWPHGGPTMSYTDSWSPRWNPIALAEQGYIVILPNITGSTGFGENFCEAVMGNWGGRPYQDLMKCWEYIEKEFSFVDMERAVCLGASYGGYMVNWIAGQPFAENFKAFVCHDGIFDTLNLVSGDIASSTQFDMGGQIFDSSTLANWDKYSPSRYTTNWMQPMLIIHSDNDFRCPITEGLAAFNVCQMKGIESRFLNFPDECHFVEGKANQLQWYRTVFGWCNKYTGVTDGVRLEPPLSEPRRRKLMGSRKET